MADDRHLITVDDRSGEWALLFEVASVLPPERWVLVGGLMVHAHAIRAGIEPIRYTSDVDVLIDITASRVSGVAGPLLAAGFEAQTPAGAGPFHRFRRDHDVVDVMVPNAAGVAQWAGRGVLRAPGVGQALIRRDHYGISGSQSGASVEVDVPDPLGAIITKAAAYKVDSRDRTRHLEDLTVLFTATSRRDLADVNLSRRDRRHLRPALEQLADGNARWWAQLDPRELAFGRAAFARLREVVDVQETPGLP